MNKIPNIVLFNPDQYRGDVLGHMDNPAAITPNMDRIVKEDGVSFRSAFCQNPVCTPSRCSMMTGWYPHVRGHRTMSYMLHEDEPVLLKTLKDNGYYVWWGGKNDLVPAQNSFEPYCSTKYKPEKEINKRYGAKDWRGSKDSDTYYSLFVGKVEKGDKEFLHDSDRCNVDGAVDYILNRREDKPFCIYLPLTDPHPPYGVEEPWYSMIDRNKIPSRVSTPENWGNKPSMLKGLYERFNMKEWSEDRWRELRAVYYGMCARTDFHLGLVIDALKKAGVYENTAIFIYTDHGDFTGDYGLVEKNANTFEDALVKVPLIIKPPSTIDVKPHISDALVELIDICATIEDITNIKPNHTHFGRSLLPVITGKTDEHRDAVFCEGGRLKGEMHTVSNNPEATKNKEGLYWPRGSLQSGEGDGFEYTKAAMIRTERYKYVHRLYEMDELYDLKNDPEELHNKINDLGMQSILYELKNRMLSFYLETGDVVPHKTDKRENYE